MKIPQSLFAVVTVVAAALSGNAQITRATFPVQTDGTSTDTVTNRLEVPSNEVWELLQVTGGITYLALFFEGKHEVTLRTFLTGGIEAWSGLVTTEYSPDLRKPLVVGPASIEVYTSTGTWATNYQGSLVYRRITNQPTPPAIPSNTVVIPTDAAGPVQIILESSQDLVTWTAAQPGTYGSSTDKRFFRLRAVVTSAP